MTLLPFTIRFVRLCHLRASCESANETWFGEGSKVSVEADGVRFFSATKRRARMLPTILDLVILANWMPVQSVR
jgi:hypothetical protein